METLDGNEYVPELMHSRDHLDPLLNHTTGGESDDGQLEVIVSAENETSLRRCPGGHASHFELISGSTEETWTESMTEYPGVMRVPPTVEWSKE